MTNDGVRGAEFAQILDSISSPRFSALTLSLGDRERCFVERGRAFAQRFLDEIGAIDCSLHRLAAGVFEQVGKRFTLVLLGDNPAVIATSFVQFSEVGDIWEGERAVGACRSGHRWTFRPANGRKVGETLEKPMNLRSKKLLSLIN